MSLVPPWKNRAEETSPEQNAGEAQRVMPVESIAPEGLPEP